MTNDVFVGSPNLPIESGNGGNTLQLAVSQQPRLSYANTTVPSSIGPGFVNEYVQVTQKWMQDVWRFQAETLNMQSRWSNAVIHLTDSVESIQEKLDGLSMAVERLASQRTFVVPLTTLAPEPMQMKLFIPATIEGDGEDFTATFSEANVSASGDTEADAIANLKESIVATYKILEAIPASEMSPLPARQWSVLNNVIAR
jgi:hypothetical protein